MPVWKHASALPYARNFFTFLLIGILFLTSTGFAIPQKPNREAVTTAFQLSLPSIIKDPSFEQSYGSTVSWGQSSTHLGTPLCTIAGCGNAGPRTGSVWARFGGMSLSGSGNEEYATVYQYVNIPSCGAVLRFYLRIGYAAPGSNGGDMFSVQLNSRTLFYTTALQKNSYSSYKLVTVNINPATTPYPANRDIILYLTARITDQVVIFNVDDVTLTPNCLTVSGNVGADAGTEGVLINYTGGSTTTDNWGNYIFNVPLGWSGTVTPSMPHAYFTPAQRTYTNLASHQKVQDFEIANIPYWISGTVGAGNITLIYTASDGVHWAQSAADGTYAIPLYYGWSGSISPSDRCFSFNPVTREYEFLTTHLNRQDYTPTFSPDACAEIRAEIGGTQQGWFGLPRGSSTRASFEGMNEGPVKLKSVSVIPLIGAERVIYKVGGVNTSFTEMMALPDKQLDNMYWLPWYNNVDLDTQLRFANVTDQPAIVTVTVGDVEMAPIELAAGASTRVNYPGVNAGPVKIESTQNIVAAERVIYKVNNIQTSFSEMMALPDKQLSSIYWLPWYNNVDLDTQLRIANVTDQPATVTVTIGGVPMTPIALAAGESTRVSYAGVNDGPVQIVGTQNIVAAERVIYKVNDINTSFTEMMALPSTQLSTTYWLPWYNNVDLDTQLRIANVTDQTAMVNVTIGDDTLPSFNLAAGESTRIDFANWNYGPVKIESTQNIVAAERVIYKVNNINTSFSEMMGLPAPQLDNLYWLPWYNNVDLDTQLRFGVP
jgi:hypothetical protein